MTGDTNDGAVRFSAVAREAALDALAVLLPIECAGCGSADRSVCAQCRAVLSAQGAATRTLLPGSLEVWSAANYDGVLRALVLALKQQGRTDVARPLRTLLRPLLNAAAAAGAELVPVPPGRVAARERGYDPVRLLMGGLACARVLRSSGLEQSAQKHLDLAARAENRQGAFVACGPCAGRRFVIVDDVLTSGATLLAAAGAIRAAGGQVLGAVTLAATPLRHARTSERAMN